MAVTCTIRAVTQDTTQTLTFDQPRVVIGRGTHADVRLPSRSISSTHAVLRAEGGELSIIDEGSSNGTLVNGALLVRGRKKVLRDGDRITVPGYELSITLSHAIADSPDRTATVARKLLADALLLAGGEGAPPSLKFTPSRGPVKSWDFPAAPSRLLAGRGDNCEIMLDDPDCSRHHAEFVRDDAGVLVRDLQSKNGVLVSGRKWTERRLKDGDEVQLGRVILAFSDPAEALLKAFEIGTDEPKPIEPQRPNTIPPPAAMTPSAGVGVPGAATPSNPPASGVPNVADASASDPSVLSASDGTGVGNVATAASSADGRTSSAPNADSNVPVAATSSADGKDRKEQGKTGATSTARRAKSRTLDWIVALLAMLILAISVIALVLVLRTH